MATLHSALEVGSRIATMGERVAPATEQAVRAGTRVAVTVIKTHGERVKLRGRNGRRVPLGAKPHINGTGTSTLGLATATPAGFWHIVQDGWQAHTIIARGAVLGPGRGQKAPKRPSRKLGPPKPGKRVTTLLKTPYGPRRYVRIPAHGQVRDVWHPAIRDADPQVQRVMAATISKTILTG